MAYKTKEAQAEASRKHYLKNKENIKKRTQLKREEFYSWFQSIIESLSCSNCGEDRYWVLDFHHRNPNEKEDTIAKLKRNFNKAKVLKEIEKCDVLCANCHRDLHYKEKIAR